jgi:redox-sensitive bicupin YhaK (pirin superfamily)
MNLNDAITRPDRVGTGLLLQSVHARKAMQTSSDLHPGQERSTTMITLRRAEDRGQADHGWLQSAHSFSFADYHDPAHMGFGPLRVINDDVVAPGRGFGMHGHRDMEIVTYVLQGELAHKDSLGHGASILPGDVQRMSAGKGILHSEFNHALYDSTHLLQIWIEPTERGIKPSYEQKNFDAEAKRGRLRLVASHDGREGSVSMNADAALYVGLFDGQEAAELAIDPARKAYVHLARGELTVNGQRLKAGDALKFEQEAHISLSQGAQAEVLVFDLAA